MSAVPDDLGAQWAEELRQASETNGADRRDMSWADPENNPDAMGVPFTWARDFPKAKPPRMIVGGVLEVGSLACMFGDSNTGKSTLALDMALRLSRGAPWRDRPTTKGIVFWLSLEAAAGTRRRVTAHCMKFGTDPAGLLFADVTTAVQFLQFEDVQLLVNAIRIAEAQAGEKCALVVVDTLARAMAGGDENGTQDMGLLVKGCDLVRRETGATVLLVHHSGKDPTKGARGSGSLRAAIDTEIEVSGQANPRHAKVTKQRDLPSGDVFAFDLEPVTIGTDPETGEPFTACVVTHREGAAATLALPRGKAQASILRALRSQHEAGATIWTLDDMRLAGRNLGQHRNTARDAVDGIITAGLLVATVGGYRLRRDGE